MGSRVSWVEKSARAWRAAVELAMARTRAIVAAASSTAASAAL
jgi:hypothetical protein